MTKFVGSGMGGMIGHRLLGLLRDKYDIVRLARSSSTPLAGVRDVRWDPPKPGEWEREIDGADTVLNLAGAPIVDKRWSAARKKELILSRLDTTRALVAAIGKAKTKPKVFLSASAIGYYGPRDAESLDEKAAPGSGFLADLCREWERQARKAEAFGVRTVLLRTGVVLAPEGGALPKMALPFRFGMGGPIGSGKQIVSWIHADDEAGAILFALENQAVEGPVNLTAPNALAMTEFAKTLGRAMKRPSFMPAPASALKLLLGERADMLLTGQRVRPALLEKAGYRFRFRTLDAALADLRP
jgi:uncharacterized protein (TIGR01777 family)